MKSSLFFIIFGLSPVSFSQTELFPEITSWKKAPVIEFENKSVASISKNQKLKNAFFVTTGSEDEVTFKFSGGEIITVRPRTKIQVPQVSPDTGDISEFIILEGSVRYKAPAVIDKRSKLRLKSAFFDLKIPSDIDAMFSLNMNLPTAKIQIIQGEFKAEFLDFEKKQILRAGEGVVFEGEKVNDQVKYDYLLNGRKSPHGVLGAVEKFDYTSLVDQAKSKEQAELAEIDKIRKEAALKLKKKTDYENSFLCKKPFGQQNECYWITKNNRCYRFRCNVQGRWGAETERPMSERCQPKPQIGLCDY